MIKYRTSSLSEIPKPVEIVRETSACVFLKLKKSSYNPNGGERRELKMSEYYQYHDTWEDARQWMLDRAIENVDRYKQSLEAATKILQQIEAMKNE